MGLLGFDPNLDDPKTVALIQMGLGLLSPSPVKMGFGGQLARAGEQGLQGYATTRQAQMQQQAMERQNRASDLQTAMGAYNFVRSKELPKMLTQGTAYQPPPELGQLESRISGLINEGNLSGTKAGTAPAPAVSPTPAPTPPTLPAAQVSQYSLAVNPALRAQGPMPQAPQAPQPQQGGSPMPGIGGPAGGLPMNAWLMVDPSGKSYMEQLAKDNAPVPLRQGDLVGRGPDGNYKSLFQQPPTVPGVAYNRDNSGQVTQAREIPNFAPAAANIKGAQVTATKTAEAPFTFQNVTTASGAQVPMSTAQLMGRSGGPTVAGLPMVSPRPQATPQPAIPPEVLAADKQGPFVATQPPGGPVTVTPQPGGKQPVDPWTTMPKMAQPTGIGVGNYAAGVQKAQAETVNRLSEKFGQKADAAQFRIATGQQALEVLDRADTGTGGALLGDVKTFLTTRAGIPESDFSNDPAATTALNKDLMTAAVAKAKSMYGARMTQNEVNAMLKRGAPNGDMIKSAIRFLVQSDMATAGYDVQQANDFGEYIGRNGDPMRFEGWYGKTFPLSKVLQGIQLAPNTPENAKASGYGWSVKRVQ